MTMGIVFVARCAARSCRAGHDDLDFLRDQFACQGIQTAHIAVGVDEAILDVLPFQPAEALHSLNERHAQTLGRRFRCRPQQSNTPDRRGRLSAADPVRDEQADATCQQCTAARNH